MARSIAVNRDWQYAYAEWDGTEFTDALHEVWRIMNRLQESEIRQGWL